MHCKSVCLLLAVVGLFAVSDAMKMTLKLIDASSKHNCWKYCAQGNNFLQITHARILQLSNQPGEEGKIIGNILCDFGKNPSYANQVCNDGGKAQGAVGQWAIMLSVTAKKQMMLSQVEYRYKENSMQLFKNGFLEPEALAKQEFKHDQHIQVQSINIDNLPGVGRISVEFNSCHTDLSYPGSLITDHGLFVSIWDGKAEDISWKRMYFDPAGHGERLVV